jgi:hypothetical protein
MGEVISINRKLEQKMQRLLEFLTPAQMAVIVEWYRETPRSGSNRQEETC